MPSDALLLTEDDLRPLAEAADSIDACLDILETATKALHAGKSAQTTFMGRNQSAGRPSARLTLATGEGMDTGIRGFGTPAPDYLKLERPANTRYYILIDGETGGLAAVMNYGLLNPLRVGAAGGLAARHLAPKGAKVLGVVGSGQQARTQVQAVVRGVPGLEQVLVYSPTAAHREAFAAEMSAWLGINARAVDTLDAAVRDADIVDLANTNRGPMLQRSQLKPGALLVSMTENQFGQDFVGTTRPVFLTWDTVAANQFPREPWHTPIKAGTLTKDDLAAELGEVIAGEKDPRRTPDDVVVYEITAFGLHDLAVAQWAYQWARQQGVGQPFVLSRE